MTVFNHSKETNAKLINFLESIIQEGIKLGLNLEDLQKKFKSIKNMAEDGIIRIVLLGSFADGKTTAIAGLLGKLDSTMKIDQDESSDELTVYRPNGLKKGFEIIDTPGLFGSKSKEVNGKKVKYSDITKKYLSQAHIIIYVCDAVTPLKESHEGVIRWIMRDLKKLDSTVFVINKMDEAGYDLTDDEEFTNGSQIKKQALIDRLKTCINLTPEEVSCLHTVCIAADPKGRGLQHWFTKMEDYKKRSHIGDLQASIDDIVAHSNARLLSDNAIKASIKDSLMTITKEITKVTPPLENALDDADNSCKDLQQEIRVLESELAFKKTEIEKRMDDYKAGLYADIRSATLETVNEVIERTIGGIENGNLTFYIVERNINSILGSAQNDINQAFQNANAKFERDFKAQEEMLNAAAKEGLKYMKNVTINKEQVLAIRDEFFKNIKFKPWGATKLAGNITKWVGRAAGALTIFLEARNWYKTWKTNKNLDELKDNLLNDLDKAFKEVYSRFNTKEAFYKNFASNYETLYQNLKTREDNVVNLKKSVQELKQYKTKISGFLKNNAETVDYQEV